MARPALPLSSWRGPPPDAGYFGNEGVVLWLGPGPESSPWLGALKQALRAADRLWEPACSIVAVSDPLPGRSPWAWRPDRELPTRWSGEEREPSAGTLEHRLKDLPGCPESLAGVVLDGMLEPLGSQAARVVCEQTAAVLAEDCPYLLLEPNGGSLRQVLGGFRRDGGPVGARPGNARTAEELRRLLELAGLGISRVCVLPSRGLMGRVGSKVLRRAASPWLIVEGRRI